MKRYQIIVEGSVFDDSDDELVADRMAFHYRNIGWKNVSVKDTLA